MFSLSKEYRKAFTTTSFKELRQEVEGLLARTFTLNRRSSCSYLHLSELVLEYHANSSTDSVKRSDSIQRLSIEYSTLNSELCRACVMILRCIREMRSNCQVLETTIKKYEMSRENVTNMCAVWDKLALLASEENPFSVISPTDFNRIRESVMSLRSRLILKRKKVRRKVMVVRFIDKLGMFRCRLKQKLRVRQMATERLEIQLDQAEKALFVLAINNDTICASVKWLQNEAEQRKELASICTADGPRNEILERVVMEFDGQNGKFMKFLEDLEDHICLHLLNMNRAARFLMAN